MDEAANARESLHGERWPATSPKTLRADFADNNKVRTLFVIGYTSGSSFLKRNCFRCWMTQMALLVRRLKNLWKRKKKLLMRAKKEAEVKKKVVENTKTKKVRDANDNVASVFLSQGSSR